MAANARSSASPQRKLLFQYAGDAYGYEPLRQAIAAYVAKTRAIQCTPAQVLIVSGSQQALDLCARVLINQGDPVDIENPGYPGTLGVFRAQGARVHTVPVDRDGIVVQQLKAGTRAIYVTPSHQFPTGASMSLARRMQLIDWARQHSSIVIEDDYDSEYRYHRAPLPALYGLASDVPVVYIGTFSKVMYPGIRLGYLITSATLAHRFAAAKLMMDRHTSLLEQMALADFIEAGHLERHVRRMRRLYQQRRMALVSALDHHFGETAEILGDHAGMHILVRFRNVEREPDPARDGVRLTSASKYYFSNAPANEYVMGFTAITERALREGVSRLSGRGARERRGLSEEIEDKSSKVKSPCRVSCSTARYEVRVGGEGGIRTHVPVTRQDAFEAPPLRPLRYLSGRVRRRGWTIAADCANMSLYLPPFPPPVPAGRRFSRKNS